MASFKIVFFKRPKVRVFSYTPRHWDPDKERLEERKKAIAKEMGVTLPEETINPDAPYRPNIKGQMRKLIETGKRKNTKFAGGRLFVFVLLALFFIGAYFGSQLFELFANSVDKKKQEQQVQEPERPKNEDTHFIIPLP